MTDNNRFALGLLAGFSLSGCLWVILVIGQLGKPHADNLWVEQAYEKKIQAARQVRTSPRVLIVAGSGAMFGVDSGILSEAWGMPVTNLGVNAGIGPHFLIDYAEPLVNPGDIVISPLEYPLYTYDGEINHVLLSFLLSHPYVLPRLPLSSILSALWTAPLRRVAEGYLGVAEDFRIAGLYGPHRLDANGDQTHSELALRDPALHQAAIKQEAEEYGAGLTDDALGWQLWREFAETLQGRGACVIFVPPPMMFKLEYVERDQESRFYRELPASARRNGLYYLGDPREFLYSPDWFFDTNYHLVAQKREFYTRALINLIGDHPLARCHEIESG